MLLCVWKWGKSFAWCAAYASAETPWRAWSPVRMRWSECLNKSLAVIAGGGAVWASLTVPARFQQRDSAAGARKCDAACKRLQSDEG